MNIGNQTYPNGVRSVLDYLASKQISFQLQVFDAPAHSASQAADLLGCPLGAIVKSLVFEKTDSGHLLLALVSGKNRADLQKLSTLACEPVRVADPKIVLSKTTYPVGAVPPCGLNGISQTLIDTDLMDYAHVWASAGAENILFRISTTDLEQLVEGKIENIKQE
jgi:prolyl-tRNA editing enzyme YbaK/EbsC (Cys-tRNA(Pro) deacylase)